MSRGESFVPPVREPLPFPPGFVGALAQYIYDTSPRPVQEISIAAALALTAGVAGRSYTVNGAATNLYIVAIARSATGKEAIPRGIARMLDALSPQAGAMNHEAPFIPDVQDFAHFGEVSSGTALRRLAADKVLRSFVWCAGEWGQYMKQMALGARAAPHAATLKRALLDLYDKGGTSAVASGVAYAKREDNIASVRGIAMTFIGTTTPITYYAALTDEMAEDGFLSRFVAIEHHGERPSLQKDCDKPPDKSLLHHMRGIVKCVHDLFSASQMQLAIAATPEAMAALDGYDLDCTDAINETTDEGVRQSYNRAHLTVWQIAGVLAVGDNPWSPVISIHHFDWARNLVDVNIANWLGRQEVGDIGQGDDARQRKLLSILKHYLATSPPASYKIPAQMPRDGVVSRKYLQIRTAKDTAFTKHQWGHKRALDDAITTLCDNGQLAEMRKEKAAKEYEFLGRCFHILQLD